MTESGIRKKLAGQGYKLKKGKDAYGCAGYMIADFNNALIAGYFPEFSMSLEDVEKWLEE